MPALEGVRVLEFGIYAAVPYASSILGDMGADVIKVEPPGGDAQRHADSYIAPGYSAHFFGLNRSKRSLAVDLGKPDAEPVLRGLLASADVVLVNYRLEAAVKLGLDYECVAAVNDRIVYGGLTGWGEGGPRAAEPGIDILAQAAGGLMGVTGEKGGPPIKPGPSLADFMAAQLLVSGVLAGLRARDRDGQGQKIALNLLDGVFAFLPTMVTPSTVSGVPIVAEGSAHPNLVPYQAFEAADKWFVLACPSDKFFVKVAEVLGLDDWLSDESLSTIAGRKARRDEVVGRLAEVFRSRTAAEWLGVLSAAGVPCAPVNSLAEAIDDPQAVHNGTVTELTHPRFGSYRAVQNPLRLSRTPVEARGYAADLGEHSRQILQEIGFDVAAVEDLLRSGVVTEPTRAGA
jgi:crotonobetainyl-CoA:carnitine CoA-transferase CaiB-like acyl-CoA transferase